MADTDRPDAEVPREGSSDHTSPHQAQGHQAQGNQAPATQARISFWAGCGIGAVAVLAAGAVLERCDTTTLYGPHLALEVTMPDRVVVGDPFSIALNARNPHPDELELDNIDVPERVLEHVAFLGMSPQASEDSPLGGGGTQTWFFETPLGPGASAGVTIEAQALEVGRHVVELAVCTFDQDCASVVRELDVVAGQLQ